MELITVGLMIWYSSSSPYWGMIGGARGADGVLLSPFTWGSSGRRGWKSPLLQSVHLRIRTTMPGVRVKVTAKLLDPFLRSSPYPQVADERLNHQPGARQVPDQQTLKCSALDQLFTSPLNK